MNKSTEQKNKEARISRLKEVVELSGLKKGDFAASLDMKPNELSDQLGGRRNITEFVASRIALKYGINPNWLLNGEGDKYSATASNVDELRQTERQKLISSIEETISMLQAQLKQLKQVI